MIDIHSHIIFDVDDGPQTVEESRRLLIESYRQGVRTIIATSHRRRGMFETSEEKIAQNFGAVKKIAQEVASDLQIFYGAEIYYSSDVLQKLERGTIPRLAETNYILIEFSMNTPYKEIHTALDRLLHRGVTPVVAHIERYHCLEKNNRRVNDMITMGCYMQINSSSVLKPRLWGDKEKTFKKRARYFLEHDLVHFVASDMHNVNERPPCMAQAYRIIETRYGRAQAQRLFVGNQKILLTDELIAPDNKTIPRMQRS